MNFNKKTIEDVQVKGKKVLVRCDFNVPLKDGVIITFNINKNHLYVKVVWPHSFNYKTRPFYIISLNI